MTQLEIYKKTLEIMQTARVGWYDEWIAEIYGVNRRFRGLCSPINIISCKQSLTHIASSKFRGRNNLKKHENDNVSE